MADQAKRWLSTKETCSLLSIDRTTLKRWVDRGWVKKSKLPAAQNTPGSRRRAAVRYDRHELERFLERRLGAKR